MTMGREVIFGDDEIADVTRLAPSLSKQQLADHFGICFNTLDKIMKRQPEVCEAYGKALATASSRMISQLYENGMNNDFQSMKLWLSHRAGWHERKELSGPDGSPVEVDIDTKWTIEVMS